MFILGSMDSIYLYWHEIRKGKNVFFTHKLAGYSLIDASFFKLWLAYNYFS